MVATYRREWELATWSCEVEMDQECVDLLREARDRSRHGLTQVVLPVAEAQRFEPLLEVMFREVADVSDDAGFHLELVYKEFVNSCIEEEPWRRDSEWIQFEFLDGDDPTVTAQQEEKFLDPSYDGLGLLAEVTVGLDHGVSG